jgi:hypothetical protein
MSELESWWEKVLLVLYPFPVFVFYWLFDTEYPLRTALRDGSALESHAFLGVGTIVYVAHWCGLIRRYPKSRLEAWPSLYGAFKPLSIGGIWVTFLFCHSAWIFIALWFVASGLKRLFAKTR